LSEIELPSMSDGRLIVRPYAPDDVQANAALCDDPTIARWETLPSPYLLADAEAWVGDAQRRWREDRWASFVVCDALSGALLGSNVVRISVRRESGEIGFMTRKDARRRGVASGGVRLLVAWCFDELGLGRLQIRADARNEASRRTIEHCGFRYEGLLRSYCVVNGERIDDVMYSLLPEDRA
jgi:RimJ/RimL family protein N-acetyltransferase